MPQDYLGLFDTPADRKEIRLGLLLVASLFAALLVVFPTRHIQLGEIDAFIPVANAIMLVAELTIAALLYAQSAVFRSRALTVLATGYVFTALLLVPYTLTFPGAFAPDGLLGSSVNTSAWLAAVRRVAFPVAVILYAVLKAVDRAERPTIGGRGGKIAVAVFSAIGLAAAMTLLATKGHDLLPPIFLDRTAAVYGTVLAINVTTIALTSAALALLLRQRKSVLDVWLLVAMSAWLAQSLLNLPLNARFTAGWYGLQLLMLASSLIVMLALITESVRLYFRLALSTAARNRERADRLMSMDALAAAVSHEVGQPLSAVVTNAMAAQSWLDRAQPEPGMAIKAMSATIEAGRRTFDVIKSIRAMFAAGSASAIAFDLNELVRETIVLMDLELTGKKVSLELTLDEGLPPVVADRVQLQRVLVNLLTNAMEAVDTKRRRPRRIAIRSMPLDSQHVQLDVTDTGVGIAPEKMDQIFEPFFTTKGTGTGLGLSLCRTIVEEHGGHLWATHGEGHGATFHLTLPTRRLGGKAQGGTAETATA